ncbi:MAG: LPXTG cell wall anchor domain-containing protein, partial [Clostridiales bacterium]|nr:LPXTG cell wall anchor domain-containing protein [Clostridiales bacterium]
FSETWTSEGTAKVLQLPAGEYTMAEDQAPLGYAVAASITFRVEADGIVQIKEDGNWVIAADAKIQMVDEPTSYEPVSVSLSATKKLLNGALKEGQFKFQLLGGDKTVIETVSNDAFGRVQFTDRLFSRTGTFTYTIREVKGDNGMIEYDSTVYRVIIKTTASGGRLSVKTDYEKDGVPYGGDIQFLNVMEMPKTGDSHLLLPLYLTVLSLLMFGGVILLKRKQERRE